MNETARAMTSEELVECPECGHRFPTWGGRLDPLEERFSPEPRPRRAAPCPRCGHDAFADREWTGGRAPALRGLESQDADAGDVPRAPVARGARKHSGVGIASFVIALGAVLLELGCFGLALVMAMANPARPPANDPTTMLVGLLGLGGAVAGLVASVLGISGLGQPQRYRAFAVLGLLLGSIVLASIVGVVVFGLAMS